VRRTFTVIVLFLNVLQAVAERINQEGRVLGAQPVVTNVMLFNTNAADAVLSAMQIFPVDNPWNECISNRPVLPNSSNMIAQIISDLATNNRTLRAFKEMNFVIVPDNQPLRPIEFLDYPDESDLNGGIDPFGMYPIPTNMPVETWPAGTGSQTLMQWQQNDDGGDRHSIVVQPGNGNIWETWRTVRTGTNWDAANGAKFNLNTNGLRPASWTSGDAAGLPMFPALVRFDECERGMVEHAMRIVVKRSRREYIYPATHYASTNSASQTNIPAMGQRVRLKASFNIADHWTKQEKAVLLGLKKYGAMVADNGNFFSISVTPDNRWPSNCFSRLATVGITNFEVIVTTKANEGPRSPGAPKASAGVDRLVAPGQPLQLEGVVTFSNNPPVIRWAHYSGPTNLTFANASVTNTFVTFQASGVYTLMLSANNGVHAVAYDALVVTVTPAITLSAANSGGDLNLAWIGGTPPFVVEWNNGELDGAWNSVSTSMVQNVTVPIQTGNGFFRVRGN
jgi:hypothetical protein